MMTDPAFYALAIGFTLILFGFSPFANEAPGQVTETGGLCIFAGLAIVALTTVIKALA